MSTDKPTQDAPIMDGALDATEKEKEAGRQEQAEIDAQSDEAKHAHLRPDRPTGTAGRAYPLVDPASSPRTK